MGDYNRSTHEVISANLSAEITDTLNKHLELHNLGSILDDVLICIESNAVKIKKGLFSECYKQRHSIHSALATAGYQIGQ